MGKIRETSFSQDGYIAQVVSGYSRNQQDIHEINWSLGHLFSVEMSQLFRDD